MNMPYFLDLRAGTVQSGQYAKVGLRPTSVVLNGGGTLEEFNEQC